MTNKTVTGTKMQAFYMQLTVLVASQADIPMKPAG